MREIRFRAITVPLKKWVFGSYVHIKQPGIEHNLIVSVDGYDHAVDPKTVGQYTGLKDKKGVEIYQGDFVRWEVGCSNNLGVIEWNEERLCWGWKQTGDTDFYYHFHMMHAENMEVIGNIYEHPHLLKQEEGAKP